MALNLDINPDDFELGEIEDFEEYCGVSFEALTRQGAAIKGKMLTALVWIIKRREEPEFTIEQARKVKVKDFVTDPTSPAPAPNGTAAVAS